ncbi:hypothetical protein B5M09_005597 [Aphanomyces astaci]|uniref:FYVE-type domain-containing protein n=1 Tax=Aphanomyces astaci TaxID=112090 RepID=A0A3R7WDK2_APHAT|nr:hypothetical protein B5M09_005597 [Aphanomyces astaci]
MLLYPPYIIMRFRAREVVVMSKFPVPQDFIYCPPLGKDERANLVNLGENSLIDLVRSSKLHSGAIKWTMDSDENGIQIFHGEDPNGPTEVTLLAGVTEVLATFDEIAALFRQETKEAYAEYTKLFAKDTLDSAHLYTISTATPDRPRHFMGVRWVVIGSPYPLLANRDLCYLECQDDFEINGKRGWGRSMTSISLPCCPDFEGHLGTIRATFIRSGFVVHESKRPGYLQVIHALQIDLKGKVPQWVVKIGMKKRARSIGDFDKYLREKRLSAKPYLRDQDLVPKSSRFKCFLCQSKFGTFSTKVRCRKCGEVVCGKCNKFWQVKTTNAGRKMIRVCSACSITGGGHDGYPKDGVASSVAVSGVASSSEYSVDERSDTSAQDSMQQETISLSGSEPQGSSGGQNYYPPAMDRARHQHYQQQHLAPSRGYPAHHGQYSHQGASHLSTVSPQWGPRNNLPIHNRTQQRNSLSRYDDHQPLPTSSSQPQPQPPLSPYSLSIRLHKDGDDDITSGPGGGSQSPHAAHGAARSTPRVDDSNASNTSPRIHDARDMYIMGATADDGEFDSATNPRGPPQQPLQAQGEYSHGSKPADERQEDNDDRLFITRESDDDNDAMSAYSEYSHAAPPLAKLVYPSRHINPLGAVMVEGDLLGDTDLLLPTWQSTATNYGHPTMDINYFKGSRSPLNDDDMTSSPSTLECTTPTARTYTAAVGGWTTFVDTSVIIVLLTMASIPSLLLHLAGWKLEGFILMIPVIQEIIFPVTIQSKEVTFLLTPDIFAWRLVTHVESTLEADCMTPETLTIQSSMAPRYSPQLQFPRDPREYARDPRDYQQEYSREYDRDPRDFARDPREYDHRDYLLREYHHPQQQQQHYDRQFPPSNPRDDPRPFRDDLFPQQPPPPPSSVQHSSDDTSSLKSDSIIQDEVLRAMKALKGEETPDPRQLLALYKQLQQLNLEGTAPTTSP